MVLYHALLIALERLMPSSELVRSTSLLEGEPQAHDEPCVSEVRGNDSTEMLSL